MGFRKSFILKAPLYLFLILAASCSDKREAKIILKPTIIEGLLQIKSGNATLLSENIPREGASWQIEVPKPGFYRLELSKAGELQGAPPTHVYLDGQEIQIEVQDGPYPTVLSNSTVQKDLSRYYQQLTDERKELLMAYGTAKYTFVNKIDQASADEAQTLMTDLVNTKDSYLKSELQITRNFINANRGSLLSAFLLYQIGEDELAGDPQYYRTLFDQLEEEVKESEYGKNVDIRTADNLKAAVGSALPAIEGKTVDGKAFDARQIQKKLTLVAFWRSVNRESAAEILELKELYKKHHSNGFEIVAVSFDKTPKRWKSFIEQNSIPWINICDFQGSSSPNLKNFNNSRIPFYWLVGPDLKIKARDVRISELPIYLREHPW